MATLMAVAHSPVTLAWMMNGRGPLARDVGVDDEHVERDGTRDGADGVEVAALEDARGVAEEDVAEHAAADAGDGAHEHDGPRVHVVHDGLVGSGSHEQADGDDVDPLDEVREPREQAGEEEAAATDEDRHGDGVRRVDHVDVVVLDDEIADEAATQTAEHGEHDEAHEVELALRCDEHA